MSDTCTLCNALTTKKAIKDYNSCAKCYKASQQIKKINEETAKKNSKLIKIDPATNCKPASVTRNQFNW